MLEQGRDLAAVGRRHGDADADPRRHIGAVDQRLGEQRLVHAHSELGGRLHRVLRLHHAELVPAEPCDHPGLADAGAEAPRGLDEQRIPDWVPMGVVHGLELVEVEAHHRERLAALAEAAHRPLELIAKAEAIGEVGQRIMQRQAPDLGVGLPRFGHIGTEASKAEKGAVRVAHRFARQGPPGDAPPIVTGTTTFRKATCSSR